MPARFSAYPPDRPAVVRVLEEGQTYCIGRAEGCEVRIDHVSVSRRHAEICANADDGQGWKLNDTGSKNGLRVDGHMTLAANFGNNAWFAIGDVYCQIELLDADAASRLRVQDQARRTGSREMVAGLSPSLGVSGLIQQILQVVLELSGLERGFVLFAPNDAPLRVHARHGMEQQDLSKAGFSGSAGAIDKAIARRESVVCCDTADSPWLGLRPSIRLGGIRALVCLPLSMADGASGAIYVDSRKPGPPVTELDLELLESVAQHAAILLSAHKLQGEVASLLNAADLDAHAQRWDELRPL